MILEALEWCVTPASLKARTRGFLAAQIAIRYRKRRCEEHWEPHLAASKRFIESSVAIDASGPRRHAVVLGGGHLNDIDPVFLKREFQRVTLVDVVHPIEVRLRAMISGGRWRCITDDLSDPSPGTAGLVRGASWVFSTCLLSQLPLNNPSGAAQNIALRHSELLHSARRAVLVTDTARRFSQQDKWEPLIAGFRLPDPQESWIWQLAPPAEHGDSNKGAEERLVEAHVFTR